MKRKLLQLIAISGILAATATPSNAQWTRDAVNGFTYVTTSTDKIGIGTNAPSYPLDIKQPGVCSFRIQSQTTGSANLILSRSAAANQNCLVNYKTGTADLWRTGCSGNNDFSINNAAGANALYISQTTNNVGIGTVNPGTKLEVDGTSLSLASGGYIMAGSLSSSNLAIDNDDIQARNNGAASTLDMNYLGGDIRFRGNLTSATVIKDNGNVGIGTLTPSSLLDVQGSAISSTTIFNTKVNYVGTNDVRAIQSYSVPADGYGYGLFATGGYVGVNATANGGTSTNSAYGVRATATGTAGIRYGVYGSATGTNLYNYGLYGEATGAGAKNWGGYILGRLNASRHLVVGNANPSYTETYTSDNSIELINGRILLKGFLKNGGYGSGIEFWDSLGTNAVSYFGSKTSTTLGFYGFTGAGWNLLNLNPTTGQVSIGIDKFATGYKLSVGGKIICEELRVQPNTAWPDYVFAKDYQLTSISDLKNSIEANGHLPGIPSSTDVENNGIAVGEMQNKMMQKIEELTLYIIQLKEENDVIKSKLSSLDK